MLGKKKINMEEREDNLRLSFLFRGLIVQRAKGFAFSRITKEMNEV